MKKNIIVAALAIACAAGLASCGKERNGIKVTGFDGENKQDNYDLGTYTYGETAKIKENLGGLRFFWYFYGAEGFEEVAKEDIKMIYFDSETQTPNRTLPEEFLAGSYQIHYYVDGHEPTANHTDSFSVSVRFDVNQFKCDGANTGLFKAELSKTEWRYGTFNESEFTVSFKNPDGNPFTKLPDGVSSYTKKDDTGYDSVSHYYTLARNYNSVKNISYSSLVNNNMVIYCSSDEKGNPRLEDVEPGDYVYFAMFSETCNYKDIVTNGVPFKVSAPTSPAGKTFKLTAARAVKYSSAQNGFVAFEHEQATYALENWFIPNIDKTVICETGTGVNANASGAIKGTCDFGFGPLGELTGEDACTWTFDADYLRVTIKNGRNDEYRTEISGEYYGQTSFTLYIEQYLRDSQGNLTDDSYLVEMSFEEVQA